MSFTILRNKYSENLEMESWKVRESSAESWGKLNREMQKDGSSTLKQY